jgi:acetyltransferase-like isoleucine patch superfamily enzyme
LRNDFRPYYLKKLHSRLQRLYVNHFLRPQFEFLGRQFNFMQPWHVELFGPNIHLGNHATVIATPDNKVRFSVWSENENTKGIFIGDACLTCPGVRISAARKITIGDGTMLASGVYLSDADWHDLYNRVSMGAAAPITLGKNVWACDNAIICKGVTIGDNSVIGARAVVIDDVPENVVVAGNPARIVKALDPEKDFLTRTEWFRREYRQIYYGFDDLDRHVLKDNTLLGYLRHRLFPGKGN